MVNERDFERMKQQIETVVGTRGADKRPASAIRRGELLPIASIGMTSTQVTAAPTMAQHNALQADVKNLFDTLELISNLRGNAKLPTV